MREIAFEGFRDKMVQSYICNINTQKISIEKKPFQQNIYYAICECISISHYGRTIKRLFK